MQKCDVYGFRDRRVAILEPGLGTAYETEHVLAEVPLLVEKVDAQRRVELEKQIDSFANR